MIRVVEERDHYLLIADGDRFAVVERRAGKLYPLRDGARDGVALDDPRLPSLIARHEWCDEVEARRVLNELLNRQDRLANTIW